MHDVAVETVIVPHFLYAWVLEELPKGLEDGTLFLLRNHQHRQQTSSDNCTFKAQRFVQHLRSAKCVATSQRSCNLAAEQ